MTNIQTLVNTYYAFYRQLEFSGYILDLLYKNKFFCNNIKKVLNQKILVLDFCKKNLYKILNKSFCKSWNKKC